MFINIYILLLDVYKHYVIIINIIYIIIINTKSYYYAVETINNQYEFPVFP